MGYSCLQPPDKPKVFLVCEEVRPEVSNPFGVEMSGKIKYLNRVKLFLKYKVTWELTRVYKIVRNYYVGLAISNKGT